MPLGYPDELEHKNPNNPIVSSLNAIGGHHEVNDISARNSIPLLKRRIRMLVSYNDGVDEVTKKFIGVAVDDVSWADENSWVTSGGEPSSYFIGALTDSTPTDAEIIAILGTAISRGAGYKAVIKDNTGTNLTYSITCDGTNYYYIANIQAV